MVLVKNGGVEVILQASEKNSILRHFMKNKKGFKSPS